MNAKSFIALTQTDILLFIYKIIMSIINASSVNEPKASVGRELSEAGCSGKYLTAFVARVYRALLLHSSSVCDLDLIIFMVIRVQR